jgi:pimeloyl-ACP methyl ester carboxylesterase
VLCLPGLTRNARDFEDVAARLAGQWRVICPDMRGRGDSDYAKDPMTYNPAQYLDDVELLLEQHGIARFVAVGTSLGGLLTMLLAGRDNSRIAGSVLNDIGPEAEEAGLERIREYVGQGRNFETWMHAARALQESQADVYPDYGVPDWLRYAKRVMALGSGGRIAFDYDMKIAEPFDAPAARRRRWICGRCSMRWRGGPACCCAAPCRTSFPPVPRTGWSRAIRTWSL